VRCRGEGPGETGRHVPTRRNEEKEIFKGTSHERAKMKTMGTKNGGGVYDGGEKFALTTEKRIRSPSSAKETKIRRDALM